MAQHYPEIIGIVLLLVFAGTMFYQGTMIMKGLRGYRHCARDQHESENMRRRLEEMMSEKINDH